MSRSGSAGAVAGALLLALAMLSLLVPYTARHVRAERTLYHADQLAYWSLASGLAEGLRQQPLSALQAVASSVASSDVSLLPAVPVAAAMTVLGDSRFGYLLAVLVTYGVLAVVTLVAALVVIDPDSVRPPWWVATVAALAALLVLPNLWRPVLIGYLDLGGVAICLAILALYLRRAEPPASLAELALIGFLVALLALFRRWFTVWAVAFAVVMIGDAALSGWRGRSLGWRHAVRPFRAPLVVGLVGVATVAVLAAPVVAMRLAPGYGDRFAAYGRSDTLAAHLQSTVHEFGVLTLSVAGAGVVWMWRRSAMRRVSGVLAGQLVVTWLLFTRLQHHGHQHWYLYGAGLGLLVGLPVVRWLAARPRPRFGLPAVVTVVVIGAVGWSSMFAPAAAGTAVRLTPWISVWQVRPVVRSDLEEVTRLLQRLDHLTAEEPGYVYVLASSEVLSDQVLAFANRSLEADFSSVRWILQSAHVDLRDGFPAMLLEARWVVVAEPVQTHLGRDHQQVVVIPAESFLEGRDIGLAFERVPATFELDGGVSVRIFRRRRPIDPEEVAELSERLRARYPDRPEVYRQ